MIEHIWSVVCGRAIVDQQTNSLTLVDVMEQLEIGAPPPSEGERGVLPMQVIVATLWRQKELGTPAKGAYSLELKAPDDTEMFKQISDVDLTAHNRLRTFNAINGIPILGPGTYRFQIRLRLDGQEDWIEVSSLPLEVVYVQANSG